MADLTGSDQTELRLDQQEEPDEDSRAAERKRDQLLADVAAGRLDTLEEEIAWILNYYPETRNSDIALYLRYWATFQPDLAGDDHIRKADLYELRRPTSLTRARATIQNTYGLFQANTEVRKQRGKLAEEERKRAIERTPSYPLLAVYADESGKTGTYLIVGSVWFLYPPQILKFLRTVHEWRESVGFEDEFHFKDISRQNLDYYRSFADLLVANAAVLSFKAISVERSGIGRVDQALGRLYYHLLVRGLEHEHTSGRAQLPRGIQLIKDLEEPGRDKLLLAELADELKKASAPRFANQLWVHEFEALDSKGQVLLQVADLFAASINRVLNATGSRSGPKDHFADYLLTSIDLPTGPSSAEQIGDVTVHVSL